MQTICELDENDAHVARHCEQHLAEVFGLRFFVRLELDAIELGNAINELGNRFTEFFGDLRLGNGGIFHDVVQERCAKRL